MGNFRPHKGGLPAQKLTHPRMIAPQESPGFGRADLITVGTSEYAIVSAIPGGFWDVSGVRDGQTGNSPRYVGLSQAFWTLHTNRTLLGSIY